VPAAPAASGTGAELNAAECEVAKSRFQSGTQANKAGDFAGAHENFTQGLSTAVTVELISALLVSRSSSLCSMLRWADALVDADGCILIRKSWARSYTCQATALEGLGRKEDADQARRLAAALAALKQDSKNEVGCLYFVCCGCCVYGPAVSADPTGARGGGALLRECCRASTRAGPNHLGRF